MLSTRSIEEAQAQCKVYLLWDSELKGFGVRVNPTGRKSFFINYRIRGRQRRMNIGPATGPFAISVADARRLATELLVQIRSQGLDPLELRREHRLGPTVSAALDLYFAKHIGARKGLGTLSDSTIQNYRNWAEPIYGQIGRLKVAAVEQDHIERAVSGMKAVTRNRVLSFASLAFNTFERWGMRPKGSNPVSLIERSNERPRDRTLSPSEMAALSVALSDLKDRHPASVAAIRVAALSGFRLGEVLAMEWSDIDAQTGSVITMESETEVLLRTLPRAALAVISDLPRLNRFVFTSANGKDAHITYRTCRSAFAEAVKLSGLEDVRPNDLRRSAVALLASTGAEVEVIRDYLGHRTDVAARRYARLAGRSALEARETVGNRMAKVMETQAAT